MRLAGRSQMLIPFWSLHLGLQAVSLQNTLTDHWHSQNGNIPLHCSRCKAGNYKVYGCAKDKALSNISPHGIFKIRFLGIPPTHCTNIVWVESTTNFFFPCNKYPSVCWFVVQIQLRSVVIQTFISMTMQCWINSSFTKKVPVLQIAFSVFSPFMTFGVFIETKDRVLSFPKTLQCSNAPGNPDPLLQGKKKKKSFFHHATGAWCTFALSCHLSDEGRWEWKREEERDQWKVQYNPLALFSTVSLTHYKHVDPSDQTKSLCTYAGFCWGRQSCGLFHPIWGLSLSGFSWHFSTDAL